MLLGFDFGMKYIGVACGQVVTKTSTPLTCIQAKDGIPNWDEIARLITTWQPEAIIVGLPLNMDGSEQHLSNCAKKFANRLQQKFKLQVHLVDERLSTWEAKKSFIRTTKKTKAQLLRINATAAAIILDQWLSKQ